MTARRGLNWDDKVDKEIMDIVLEAQNLLSNDDPVKSRWLVNPKSKLNVWTDASSVAVGVVLEIDGDVIEDAC